MAGTIRGCVVSLTVAVSCFMMADQAVAGSGWGECRWVAVGPARSHQAGEAWCPAGYFLTQLDLDSSASLDPHDSPIVGQAQCCRMPGNAPAAWKNCAWVSVGVQRSHQRGAEWCPQGSFLTQLDFDGDRNYSANDTPFVGQAMCCRPAGGGVSRWSSSDWVPVGGKMSHQPAQPWCPPGTYLTQLDLDGGTHYSPHDGPVVGAARCSRPQVTASAAMVTGVITGVVPASVVPAVPAGTRDLKITKLNIQPLPEGVNGPKITLHTFRSYRVDVTIRRSGAGQSTNFPDFTVRTECVRGGSHFLLGETRLGVGPGSGGDLHAVYDIFPSSAGHGDCLLRTIVDADNDVAETDESPLSNTWERKTLIAP